MILHEAASVFLIIGSVLLGQIEVRQRTPQPCDPTVSPCFTYETSAETCARAMREIGANRKHRIEGGQRVLCIPSPSGLIR